VSDLKLGYGTLAFAQCVIDHVLALVYASLKGSETAGALLED
jgi:hypothetical protein